MCGRRACALVPGLLQPNRPADTENVAGVELYYSPQPNEIVGRFIFYNRDRNKCKGLAEVTIGLRKLFWQCTFGKTWSDMPRDRLVRDIINEKIQRGLLAEPKLTLNGCSVGFGIANEKLKK